MDKEAIKKLQELADKTKDEKIKKVIGDKIKAINKPVTK